MAELKELEYPTSKYRTPVTIPTIDLQGKRSYFTHSGLASYFFNYAECSNIWDAEVIVHSTGSFAEMFPHKIHYIVDISKDNNVITEI